MKIFHSLHLFLRQSALLFSGVLFSLTGQAVQYADFENSSDSPPFLQNDYIDNTISGGPYVTWSYPVDPLDANNILYRIDALPETTTLNIAPEAYSIATNEDYPGPIYTTVDVAEWNTDARFFLLAAVTGNEVAQHYGIACSSSQCDLIRTDVFGTETVLDTAAVTLDGNERYRLEFSRSGAAHDQLSANLYELPNTTPLLTLSTTDATYAANTLRAVIRVSSTALTQATVDFDNFYAFNTSASAISSTPSTIVGTEANGLLGSSVTVVGDVNGDGFNDILAAAPDAANTSSDANAGIVYLYSGSASGLVPTPAWQYEGTAANLRVGATISAAGDVNNDTYADVLVSTGAVSPTAVPEVYLFLGGAGGLSATPDLTITNGANLISEFGASLLSLGDINGDGFDDVLIGAPGETADITDGPRGTAFVSSSQLSGSSGIAAMDAACVGDATAENFPGPSTYKAWVSTSTESAVDRVIDQGYERVDGLVIVSSSSSELGTPPIQTNIAREADGGTYNGNVWTGTDSTGQLHPNNCNDWNALSGSGRQGLASATGGTWTDNFNRSCSATDPVYCFGGGSSVVIASVNTGQAWLYFGSATGIDTANPEALLTDVSTLTTLDAEPTPARFGQSLAFGEVDGNGIAILIDAPGGATRRTYAFGFDKDNGTLMLSPHWEAQMLATGNSPNSLLSGIDINNDGFDEILIGDPGYDDTAVGGTNGQIGRTLIFNGASTVSTTPTTEILGVTPSVGQFGSAFSGGDLNLDRFDDVVISDTTYSNGEVSEGAAYVFLGSVNGLSLSPDNVLESNQASSALGQGVALGDIDNDGQFDVVAGANGYNTNLGALLSYASVLVDFDGDGLTDVAETTVHGSDPQNRNSDSDGIEDGIEVNTHGTNPVSNDTDGDGLLDNFEITHGFDPVSTDESALDGDSDGLTNLEEQTNNTDPTDADSDDDGLNDGDEVNTHSSDPNNSDTDGDGLPDGFEVANGYNPLVPGEQFLDPDNDGLPNGEEVANGTDFNDADSDDDDLEDGFEVLHGFNPLLGGQENQDSDGDGLDNLEEQTAGTDPNNSDTDGDGFTDFFEVNFGTDPADAGNSPVVQNVNGTPPVSGNSFAQAVAVDGDVAVIGAPTNGAGSAYLFVRNAGLWSQLKILAASDATAGDAFGISVAVHGDIVVVGAEDNDDAASSSGSAYVFSRNLGGTDNWGELTKLVATDPASGARFGRNIGISNDVVAIGDAVGAVYLFGQNQGGSDNWGFVKKISGAGNDGLSLHASTLVVGDSGAASTGVANVYEKDLGGADNWGLAKQLVGSNSLAADSFGASVSIFSDSVVVGAINNDAVADRAGIAYVFRRDEGGAENWGEVQILTASNGVALDRFGGAVSVSGNTLLVSRGSSFGAVYVFRNLGARWREEQQLSPLNQEFEDGYGISVAISNDSAVVGAVVGNGVNDGTAYLYDFDVDDDGLTNFFESQNGFNQQVAGEENADGDADGLNNLQEQNAFTDPTNPDTDGDGFSDGDEVIFGTDPLDSLNNLIQQGINVGGALSDVAIDGDVAVFGTNRFDQPFADAGAAHVFVFNTGLWSFQKTLFASDAAADDYFGSSVAVSGNTIAVGATGDDDDGSGSGSVYIFDRNEGGADNWGQVAKLSQAFVQADASFGAAVALSADTLIVGSPGFDLAFTNEGRLYLYGRDQGGLDNWGLITTIGTIVFSNDGAVVNGAEFGTSVDISGDIAIAGAPFAGPNVNTGGAYLFERNLGGTDNWGMVKALQGTFTFDEGQFGLSVSLDGDQALVGEPSFIDYDHTYGQAHLFQQDQGGQDNWGLVKHIRASDEVFDDGFGAAVSISGSNIVVGSPGDDPGATGAGSVYLFSRDEGGFDNWGQVRKYLPDNPAASNGFGSQLVIDGDYFIVAESFAALANDSNPYIYGFDGDFDGVGNLSDNCRGVSNTDQANNDLAYEQSVPLPVLGDACDLDDDNGPLITPAQPGFGELDLLNNVSPIADAGILYYYIPDVGYLGPHPLCFEGANIPTWATLNSATGAITGTPVDSDYGDYTGITLTATEAIVTPAQGAMCVPLAVLGGQSETSAPFTISVHESTKPNVTTAFASTVSNTTIPVTLACSDPNNGSGCKEIYWAIDGTASTSSTPLGITSPNFNGTVDVLSTGTLHFIAEDNAGNISDEGTIDFTIDTQAPTVGIDAGLGNEISDTTGGADAQIQFVGEVDDNLLELAPLANVPSVDAVVTYTPTIGDVEPMDLTVMVKTSGTCVGDDGAGGDVIVDTADAGVDACWETSYTPPVNDGSLSLQVTATDAAGNTAVDSRQYDHYTGAKVFTDMTLSVTPNSIEFGNSVVATLDLSVLSANTPDLMDLPVTLTVTPPATSANPTPTPVVINTQITNPDGSASVALGDVSTVEFTTKGVWQVQADFGGNIRYLAAQSSIEQVFVGASAGYAVLIQGSSDALNGLGRESYNKTLNRVYETLRRRGFQDDDIIYYNYDQFIDTDGDGFVDAVNPGVDFNPNLVGKAHITNRFADNTPVTSLVARINQNPAPLYVVMIDHGNTDGTEAGTEFLFRNSVDGNAEIITPADVDLWLDTLEDNLSVEASQEPRIVINGFCYSGGFVEPLAGSTGIDRLQHPTMANRVVISSSAWNEVSYKGPVEGDGIRAGEYFIEELFGELENDKTLTEAFVVATEKTELLTREKDGLSINGKYLDASQQHPQLEDNGLLEPHGDYGSNVIQDALTASAHGDGVYADSIYLGVAPDTEENSVENPGRFVRVTPTRMIANNEDTVDIYGVPEDNGQVSNAFVEIRSPGTELDGGIVIDSQSGLPVSEQLNADNISDYGLFALGSAEPNACNPENASPDNSWCHSLNVFSSIGKYEIYYYVEDKQTGELSPAKRSVVYKRKSSEVLPTAFNLSTPADLSEVKTTAAMFRWGASTDDDGLTYTLTLCEDAGLTQGCRLFEEITSAFKSVQLLKDNTTYHWKVTAIDNFGAQRDSSDTFEFTVALDGNNIIGVVQGFVQSAVNFDTVTAQAVNRDDGLTPDPVYDYVDADTNPETGYYELLTISGVDIPVLANAPGYQAKTEMLDVPNACSVNQFVNGQCTPVPVTFNFQLDEEIVDTDGDGLSDDDEVNIHGTNPNNQDSDGDGLNDGDEVNVNVTDPNDADSDGDGLNDGDEVNVHATDPNDADSDGDGVDDGLEISFGTDPNDDMSLPVNVPALPLWAYALLVLVLGLMGAYSRAARRRIR